MNLFMNYLVLIQFAAYLSNVVSHTVLLRPVKSSNSGFKVPTRHEVTQSKILKEATSQYVYKKSPSGSSFFLGHRESDRTRVPLKKESRPNVYKNFVEHPSLTVPNFPAFSPLLLSQTLKEPTDYSDKDRLSTRNKGNNEKILLNQRNMIHKKPWKWPEQSSATLDSGERSTNFIHLQSNTIRKQKNAVSHLPQNLGVKDAEAFRELFTASNHKELTRPAQVHQVNPEKKNKNGAHVEQDYNLQEQNNYASKLNKVPNFPDQFLPKHPRAKINVNKLGNFRQNSNTKPNNFTSANEYPVSSLKSQFDSNLKSFRPNETFIRNSKQPLLSYKPKNLHGTLASNKFNEGPPSNSKLIVPNIRYINALTTAYFGGKNPKSSVDESKIQLTEHLNLTQALDFLRNNKTRSIQKFGSLPNRSNIEDLTFQNYEKQNRGVSLTEERNKRSKEKSYSKSFTKEKHKGRIKNSNDGNFFSNKHIESDFPKLQFSNFYLDVKKHSNLEASIELQRYLNPFHKNRFGNFTAINSLKIKKSPNVSHCYKIQNHEIRDKCIQALNFTSLNLRSRSQLDKKYTDFTIFPDKTIDKNAKYWIGNFPANDIFTRNRLKHVSNSNENLNKLEKDVLAVLPKELEKNRNTNAAHLNPKNDDRNPTKHQNKNSKSITVQNQSKFLSSVNFSTGIKSGSQKSVEYLNDKNWIPITDFAPLINAKESVRPVYRLSRKIDEVTLKKKNKTTRTFNSDHYVIDDLKEDENVRKGEVVEDTNHYFKIMTDTATKQLDVMPLSIKFSEKHNSARNKREAQGEKEKLKVPTNSQPSKELCKIDIDAVKTENSDSDSAKTHKANGESVNRIQASNLFQKKRTLTRLSGSDFLTRYLKKHSKPDEKVTDFWKVSTPNATIDKVSGGTDEKQITKATAEPTTVNYISQSGEVKEFKTIITTTPRNSIQEKKVPRVINKELSESHEVATTISTIKSDQVKSEIKQAKEYIAISSPDTVQMKVTKKPEIKQKPLKSEITKKSDFTEEITAKPKNQELKNPSEIPRETDRRGSTKSRRRKEPAFKTPEADDVPIKSRTSHYTTINRNANDSKDYVREEGNKYEKLDESPILYYIVNERTRRGRWVSYPLNRETRLPNSKKRTKVQKHKIKTIKRKKLTN